MNKRKLATPPPAPTPTLPARPNGTSTPVGWSFWNSFGTCQQLWWLKYVLELTKRGDTPSYFTVGSAYHAFMEGKSREEVAALGPEYQPYLDEGERLKKAREAAKPPLPEVIEHEKLFVVQDGPLKGIFTSRPDRIERRRYSTKLLAARDFKTAASLKATDALYYSQNGEIMGELLATGLSVVYVDIITKAEKPQVAEIEVRMTVDKQLAFVRMIEAWAQELRAKLKGAKSRDDLLERHGAFPRDLTACVQRGFGGDSVCTYYDRCWGAGATGHLYTTKEHREWVPYLLGK